MGAWKRFAGDRGAAAARRNEELLAERRAAEAPPEPKPAALAAHDALTKGAERGD